LVGIEEQNKAIPTLLNFAITESIAGFYIHRLHVSWLNGITNKAKSFKTPSLGFATQLKIHTVLRR
jgi:hypothetical protein